MHRPTPFSIGRGNLCVALGSLSEKREDPPYTCAPSCHVKGASSEAGPPFLAGSNPPRGLRLSFHERRLRLHLDSLGESCLRGTALVQYSRNSSFSRPWCRSRYQQLHKLREQCSLPRGFLRAQRSLPAAQD